MWIRFYRKGQQSRLYFFATVFLVSFCINWVVLQHLMLAKLLKFMFFEEYWFSEYFLIRRELKETSSYFLWIVLSDVWRMVRFSMYILNSWIRLFSAVTWRTDHDEHIVADAFRSKKSLSALLVHEQQASQKWCLSSRHLTACGDYKIDIYENQAACAKRLNVERWHIKCL